MMTYVYLYFARLFSRLFRTASMQWSLSRDGTLSPDAVIFPVYISPQKHSRERIVVHARRYNHE